MTQAVHKMPCLPFANHLRQGAKLVFALSLCLLFDLVHAGGPRPNMDKEALPAALQVISAKYKLDRQELESLLAEFEELRQTNADDVDQFKVKVASPERIDQLYQWPEVALIPRSLRENGLIFAGHPDSKLLSFNKPSDIIHKMSLWFPEELARARANHRLWLGDIHLRGPFANWGTEASAFLAMWNCMPQITWLQPEYSPFRKTTWGNAPLAPLAAGSSDYREFDFGQCVREKNGYRGGSTLEKSLLQKRSIQTQVEKVVPTLQSRFASFLEENRCRGNGPDDCVLMVNLWASLTPHDPLLATMIQSIEAETGLGTPLPAMKKPYLAWSPQDIDAGAERFDEVWRRAAFLRAKFVSILGNTQAWPADALQQTTRQLIELRLLLQTAYAYHFDYVDMNYRSPASSPWIVLYSELRRRDKDSASGVPAALLSWEQGQRDEETVQRVQAVVVEELGKIDGKVDCRVFEPWLTPALRARIGLSHRLSPVNRLTECAQPDWKWLTEGVSEEAMELRNRYVDLVGTLAPQLREELLSHLTHDGNNCFPAPQTPVQGWQRKLCQTWVHEPTTVSLHLKNSGLDLEKSRAFHKISASRPADAAGSQYAWLSALADGLPAKARTRLNAYAKDLDRQGVRVKSTTLWRHPGHSSALIELGLYGGNCTRLIVLLSPSALRKINVPQRIWQESSCHSEILRVSDLDQDGNLEIWFPLENWGAASFDACKGDDGDLVRNLDCSAIDQPTKMGEISDDVLSFFVNNRASHPRAPKGENWTSTGQPYPLPVASASSAGREPSCNSILVGSVLAAKLGIANWNEAVIDLTCAPHPVNRDLTLLALFHELRDATSANNESRFGLVVAEIDIKRHRLVRVYREVIEEDATTRIRGSSGSLRLDTARYHLAPHVRAFGVRMNTGYSPRYAEGGSNNFLSLFVEEGSRLRPVLQGLPLSSWTMTDSRGCFTNDETPAYPCEIEREELQLSISSTAKEAWRDLDVIATKTRDGERKPFKKGVTRKLRYKEGAYH